MNNRNLSLFARVKNRIRYELLELHNSLWDSILRIRTKDKFTPSYVYDINGRNRPNEGTSYKALKIIFQRLCLGSNDVLIDVGCGFGRTVCYFSRQNVSAIGIELRPEIAESARKNVKSLKGKHAPVRVICGDATQQDYSIATVVYFYNPFDSEAMAAVLSLLKIQNPDVTICYANPVERDTLENTDWLENVDNFVVPYRHSHMPVGVWKAKAPWRSQAGRAPIGSLPGENGRRQF